MLRFAVSATLTRQLIDRLNIQTYINIFDAVSESEAIGKFMFNVSKRLPEHSVHVRPVSVLIEERGKAKGSRKTVRAKKPRTTKPSRKAINETTTAKN